MFFVMLGKCILLIIKSYSLPFFQASELVRRSYDIKCKHLRQLESKRERSDQIDRTRAVVKDLYSRIKVAIHRIDSISKRIEELRDRELQPQLEELIEGYCNYSSSASLYVFFPLFLFMKAMENKVVYLHIQMRWIVRISSFQLKKICKKKFEVKYLSLFK